MTSKHVGVFTARLAVFYFKCAFVDHIKCNLDMAQYVLQTIPLHNYIILNYRVNGRYEGTYARTGLLVGEFQT